MATQQLFGRSVELERISRFVDAAQHSGDTRLVRGEPGVGKSVLLDAAADMAHAAGMRVLRASGSEFEADVSNSGLNQLLLPLRNDLHRLPPGARDALSVALGFGPGPPPGALLVCNAALSLVMAVADQTPVLLLVDDVQWVDRASAVVLGFIARRVEGHPIGLVMSCRTGSERFLDRRGLTDVVVQPLDRQASEHLVDARFPHLPPRTRQRLLDLAQGNPLALVELPATLTGPTAQAVDQPDVVPLSDQLQSLFASRIADLPDATRRLLLVAAFEGAGDVRVLREVAGERPGLGDLAPAERAQLVHIDDAAARITFRHPLIRSAIVAMSTHEERRHAHLVLADALHGDQERQDRLADNRESHWRLVHRGRDGGAPRRHIGALMHLCLDDYLTGRWDEADELAREGQQVCATTGFSFFAWYFLYNRALIAAGRGHADDAYALADEITHWATPRGVTSAARFAHHPRTLAAAGQGDFDAAFRHASALSPPGVLAAYVPHCTWVMFDLVEAALRTGHTAEAQAHLEAIQTADVAALSPRMELIQRGVEALLLDDETADARLEALLIQSASDRWLIEACRIRLAFAEKLRRKKAFHRARRHLLDARTGFAAMGAQPWLTRTHQELRATGYRPADEPSDAFTALTAQELEVAHLAASGLTNRQIAERLYLSHRTVGAHLYRVFPKLGVSSRAGLRDALSARPGLDRPAREPMGTRAR